MSESEAGEVSSSTDAAITSPSPDNEMVSSTQHHEDLAEAVNSITTSGFPKGNVVTTLVTDPDQVESMDQISFSGDQQGTVSASIDSLAQDTQNSDYTIINANPGLTSQQPGHVILTTDGTVASEGQGVSLADTTTLQSLLAAQGHTSHLTTANGETIQIIAVSNPNDLTNSKMWQVMPAINSTEFGIIINNQTDEPHDTDTHIETGEGAESASNTATQVVDMVPVSDVAEILMPPPSAIHNLPPGCPAWAARLKDCEKIGDAYRGWVESEVELDLLLTYHKQQTVSFWGTRQSPSPAKQSTRLMWKSQYVPFDGLPFINAGSRAIVMECQYGPRRKGAAAKRAPDQPMRNEFKQTCPARIYIKKVRKFPEFAVNMNLDKKSLKMAMDKSFQMLKERGMDSFGQERFYVQLPTEQAHEFHSDGAEVPEIDIPHRLHPSVAQKIRDIVASGETKLYAVRKALRRFVERDLFDSAGNVPEKHNLTYYPTVNDLQNHIHQAIKDIESGLLPLSSQAVVIANTESGDENSQDIQQALWQSVGSDQPHAETVTVTLTQNPGEDGHHVISRVETHLSDGTTQVSTELTPETATLLSKLHPNMFPAGSLLHELQDQTTTSSTEPQQAVTMVTNPADVSQRQDAEQQVAVSQQLALTQEALDQTIDSTNLTSLQIVPSCKPGQATIGHNLQGIQIVTQESLNSQGMQIIQQAGDNLQHGIQLIPNDGGLTDASGHAIQIVSDGTGQGISFIQQSGAGDGSLSQDLSHIQDCDGVITIAMAPDAQMIKTEVEELEAMDHSGAL